MSDAFEQYLAEATLPCREVSVCFDRKLLYDLADAEKAGDDKLVKSLTKKVEASRREMSFEKLDGKLWRDLISKHPPNKKQKAEGHTHNPETFYPAAMAATCIEPGITFEQAEKFCDTFPVLEVEKVMAVVYELHAMGGRDPFDSTGSRQVSETT